MNTATSANAVKFLAKNPTFIGSVKGFDFYEHPELGDEVPLLVITPQGLVKYSEFFELPSPFEFYGI